MSMTRRRPGAMPVGDHAGADGGDFLRQHDAAVNATPPITPSQPRMVMSTRQSPTHTLCASTMRARPSSDREGRPGRSARGCPGTASPWRGRIFVDKRSRARLGSGPSAPHDGDVSTGPPAKIARDRWIFRDGGQSLSLRRHDPDQVQRVFLSPFRGTPRNRANVGLGAGVSMRAVHSGKTYAASRASNCGAH